MTARQLLPAGLLLSLLLLVLQSDIAYAQCSTNSTSTQLVTVDGSFVNYQWTNDNPPPTTFVFTTGTNTTNVVYYMNISVLASSESCVDYPWLLLKDCIACPNSTACNALQIYTQTTPPSGTSNQVQQLLTYNGVTNAIYPLLPSTTYYLTATFLDNCVTGASLYTLYFAVSTAPIPVLQSNQTVPITFYEYPSLEGMAYMQFPITNLIENSTLSGISIHIEPSDPLAPPTNYLLCAYAADANQVRTNSSYWTYSVCNQMNSNLITISLPGGLPSTPDVLNLAVTITNPGEYGVVARYIYACPPCQENQICNDFVGVCECLRGYGYNETSADCNIPIQCVNGTVMPCYKEDGQAQRMCVNNVWSTCNITSCNDGYEAQLWGNETTETYQCIAITDSSPNLILLWIALGIIGVIVIYLTVGLIVFYYQHRQKKKKNMFELIDADDVLEY